MHFVESVPGKRRSIQIKPVSYPLSLAPSAPALPTGGGASPSCIGDQTGECGDSVESDHECSGQPSSHRVRKEKAVEAWEEVQSKMTPAMMLGFPSGVVCVFCKSCPVCVWCPDCGANAYLCEECTFRLHKEINLFTLEGVND